MLFPATAPGFYCPTLPSAAARPVPALLPNNHHQKQNVK
nr:MAG TPA_asm: hypothetical protein [Caudoviricetes sp.]DAL79906.1 MAG TPA: hypothetical protein [Caudoviricetes sp.]DAR38644.1 MAG TPA: hypothetical protein [Caudoviricetes sp.]